MLFILRRPAMRPRNNSRLTNNNERNRWIWRPRNYRTNIGIRTGQVCDNSIKWMQQAAGYVVLPVFSWGWPEMHARVNALCRASTLELTTQKTPDFWTTISFDVTSSSMRCRSIHFIWIDCCKERFSFELIQEVRIW